MFVCNDCGAAFYKWVSSDLFPYLTEDDKKPREPWNVCPECGAWDFYWDEDEE